jgi:uroporphyrinogen-III decarboxylase
MADNQLYQERLLRVNKAIRCEAVDRVPLIFQGTALAPRQMGLTMAEYVYNPLRGIDSHLDYMDRLGVDGCNTPPWYRPDVGLSVVWLSHLKMPGRELPDDALWQVEEKEVMSVDDYDTIINRGVGPFLEQYLPKVVDMREFLDGQAQTEKTNAIMFQRVKERQYPIVTGAMSTIPFESLCGGRSMTSFFIDLFRIPQKVKAAMDAMMPMYIGMALEGVAKSGIRSTWIGGWRTASALLPPKFWNEFVFPYFQTFAQAMSEKDIVCIFHLDHNWTRDLGRFRELPEKKCILNLDGMTDIRKAREILGDHMAIMGDVPSPLLTTGEPDAVYKYVRDLIRDTGAKGLLLCAGCDAPINARHENILAMYEAGREYGR